MPPTETLITCEHADNGIPPEYEYLFEAANSVLESHRGFDPGTEELGIRLASALDTEPIICRISRLLIEANRSLHHPRLFSSYTRGLPEMERQKIIDRYYLPHRHHVERSVKQRTIRGAFVLHISVHSFTPILDGEVRNADVSFLYDPRRPREKEIATEWKKQILRMNPQLRVRFNYPYLGIADGLTTHLRRMYSPGEYAGLEIEINQRFPLGAPQEWKEVQETVIESLVRLLPDLPPND